MGWAGAAEEDLECGIVIDAIGAAVSEDTRVVYAATPHDIERMGINAEDFDVCVCVVSEVIASDLLVIVDNRPRRHAKVGDHAVAIARQKYV